MRTSYGSSAHLMLHGHNDNDNDTVLWICWLAAQEGKG
jgi:hypothetical protein